MLEKLKEQHAQFVQQLAQTQINFQQLQGAIFSCEALIKQFEEKVKEEESGKANHEVEG